MKCERCGIEHDGLFGSGRFCSMACANRRIVSELNKQRVGEHNWLRRIKTEDPITYVKFCERQSEIGKGAQKGNRARMIAISDAKSWENLGKDGKSNRVKREQGLKCNRCGLSEWQGAKLPLELEHKDGNHMNDERDNLEALCPNCHSITHTWRGKNKSMKGKVTDEALIYALKNTESIRQALILVGMTPRGGNYVRAKRLLATSDMID